MELAIQVINNAGREVVDLRQKPAMKSDGAELNGDEQAGMGTVPADFLLVSIRKRPVSDHFLIGEILRQGN